MLLAVAAPAAASATDGSVPAQVKAYVTDGSLVERLDDLYGLNEGGTAGIDFDETTTTGPISRVWTWTDERLAGKPTQHPTQLTNYWLTPISLDGQPLGYAVIWINPELDAPELASFEVDADAAVAMGELPDAAQLVRDDGSSAWFALQDGILTPIVPGTSGLETPAPVDEVALLPAGPDEPTAAPVTNDGLGVALAVLGALVVVIAVALAISRRRGRDDDLSSSSS